MYQLIEIFDGKLQSDDLLIIIILFFLYTQQIDDIYLYIALFMLLIN